MLQGIFAVFASLFSMGTGLLGINNQNPQQPSYQVTEFSANKCYNPEPDVKLTLKWPDNFQNLTDYRPQLNPTVFPPQQFPATFNSKDICNTMLLTNLSGEAVNPREYIRVRRDLRISSCKTDELAGPFVSLDKQTCTQGQTDAAKSMRGDCTVSGIYPDLRKVAEARGTDNTIQEIFWTPFTHNVGCEFDLQNPNCGKGDGSNMNMREFIYVLKDRKAFDPASPEDCVVRWDERVHKNNPCSHYFDIYMSKDLYDRLQTIPTTYVPVPTTDPRYDKYAQNYYLFKQRMESCTEQNTFTPAVLPPGLSFPPDFIEKPFKTSDFASSIPNKIIISSPEIKDYCKFVIKTTTSISTNSLYNVNEITIGSSALPNFNICPPNPPADLNQCPEEDPTIEATRPSGCFTPIGSLSFTDINNQNIVFKVYSNWDKPTNFYLKDTTGVYPNIYEYISTPNQPPEIKDRASTLQLAHLEFINASEWTWATPICKPAVYLYPEKETDINVKLNIDGKITVSDPIYDDINGWNVKAHPDGKIQIYNNLSPSPFTLNPNTYPYLYYEADISGIDVPSEGWVVDKSNTKNKIENIMQTLGFNTKEINDFNEYWLPRLSEKPYYFITLLPENIINTKEKLTFSQKPDTLIRARFVFEGLEYPASIKPLELKGHKRQGFTVTDWGGSLVGSDCQIKDVK